MNIKITALTLAAATAFAFTPKPAVADDRGLAVVGGLIGGLIIGSAIADHHDDRAVYVSHRSGGGYWDTVVVNVWVPGYWVEERGYHGRYHRHFIPGHYERRHNRVWVSHDRHNRYDRGHNRHDRDYGHDRRDRDHGRGYDYDRRDRDGDRDDRNDRRR